MQAALGFSSGELPDEAWLWRRGSSRRDSEHYVGLLGDRNTQNYIGAE